MSLQGGLQVVLQHPLTSGGTICRGFTGLPNVAPAWFLVEALHPTDESTANDVGDDIAAALISLGPNVHELPTPCRGTNFGHCHAAGVRDCSKVLLPVAGAQVGTSQWFSRWKAFGALASVCPVLGPSAHVAAMPANLRAINGVKWSRGDPGAIAKILRLGGLVSARPRIFISYVRAETEALAEQLHDHLVKEGFEVFLDRFSVKPGVDFQVRLTEELSRMGTVLVLESASILKSKWVRHEIQFARMHRLGRVALQLPKGTPVPGVDPAFRATIGPKQLNSQGKLTAKDLQIASLKIQNAHAQAERFRIANLRDAMSDALLLNGYTRQGFDVDGTIVGTKGANEYAFAVRNLPPEMADFHAVEGHRHYARGAFVIAPAKYMDWQNRRSLAWLSSETTIGLEDEGDMVKLVRSLP